MVRKNILMYVLLDCTAAMLAYPFTTVEKRMMLAATMLMAYTSTLDCILTIALEEGVGAFFTGALQRIITTHALPNISTTESAATAWRKKTRGGQENEFKYLAMMQHNKGMV